MSSPVPPQITTLRQAAEHFGIDRGDFSAIVKSAGIPLLAVPSNGLAKGLDNNGMKRAAKLVARFKSATVADSVSA